jgi:hypothetical protein
VKEISEGNLKKKEFPDFLKKLKKESVGINIYKRT